MPIAYDHTEKIETEKAFLLALYPCFYVHIDLWNQRTTFVTVYQYISSHSSRERLISEQESVEAV